MEHAFRGRKSYATQNVMAAVDLDLRFTYVLAGWEGTSHDANVLRDALERVNGLRVPHALVIGRIVPHHRNGGVTYLSLT